MINKNVFPFSELKTGLLKILTENSYQPETLVYFEKKLESLGLIRELLVFLVRTNELKRFFCPYTHI